MRRSHLPSPLSPRLGVIALLAVASLVSCTSRIESCGCDPTLDCGPPTGGEAEAPAPGSLAPAVAEGAIYLDLSWTMRGFIADRGYEIPFTRFQQLLRTTLPEAFVEVDLPSPAFHGFGGDLVPAERLAPMLDYAVRSPDRTSPRTRYDQGQTDVVGMLERAAGAPGTLSVVVTDNAQDVLRSGGRRVPGFDRSSFVKTVTDHLAGRGFGVWLVGVQNEFEGTYFSIQPVFDQDGLRVNSPLALRGRRPFYVWVVSRDLDKGRRFVAHLAQRLDSGPDGNGDSGDRVHAIELAPGLLPQLRLAEPEAPAADNADTVFSSTRWFRIHEWQDRGAAPAYVCLAFDRSEQSIRHQFPLLGVVTPRPAGDPVSRLQLPPEVWRTELRPHRDGSDLPGLQIDSMAGERPPTPGSGTTPALGHMLTLNPVTMAAARPDERSLDLDIDLRADLSALPADHWITTWSTPDDTTPEAILGKTLYLEDVVLGILTATVGRPQPSRCVRLCFARTG